MAAKRVSEDKKKDGVKKKYLTPPFLCSKILKAGKVESFRGFERMDKLYEQTMLFDFYGELLTEHQRKVFEDAVYNDLSLSEIAEEQGISRQGVHDLIKRCTKILQEYEAKLHLVERFARAKKTVEEIERLAKVDADGTDSLKRPEARLQEIETLTKELLLEL